MPSSKPAQADNISLPESDRRRTTGDGGMAAAWRRFKGMLKRPIRLQRHGLQWHIVLVDRRRNPVPFKPASEVRMLAELEARLLAIDHQHAAAGMRQLLRVHEELRRNSWRGVEQLPARELGRALAQCELLNSLEPSPAMAALIERLRILKTGAELRDERAGEAQQEVPVEAPDSRLGRALARSAQGPLQRRLDSTIEVSETSYDAYDEHERGWVDTVQPEADAEPAVSHQDAGEKPTAQPRRLGPKLASAID